jgi:hypothetical protein
MVLTDLLWGPLLTSLEALPLRLGVRLCDLRPRFLLKGRVGPAYRAIARNGRVLLATDRSLAELVDRPARMRLQVWHRRILPGDAAEPYGLLFSVRGVPLSAQEQMYATRLVGAPASSFALAMDLGGGLVLEFRSLTER